MAKFKGTREAFAAAMMDLADEGKDVYGVYPDALKAMRAVAFGDKYPERYIECGIAEQCAVDVAAGMASAGCIPFVGTYCGFMTMRAGEQMRTFVGYTDLNVKCAGFNAGCLGGEREGVTHQFYEDLAFVSSLPNFTILTPADGPLGAQVHGVLRSAITRATDLDRLEYRIRARQRDQIDVTAVAVLDNETLHDEVGDAVYRAIISHRQEGIYQYGVTASVTTTMQAVDDTAGWTRTQTSVLHVLVHCPAGGVCTLIGVTGSAEA